MRRSPISARKDGDRISEREQGLRVRPIDVGQSRDSLGVKRIQNRKQHHWRTATSTPPAASRRARALRNNQQQRPQGDIRAIASWHRLAAKPATYPSCAPRLAAPSSIARRTNARSQRRGTDMPACSRPGDSRGPAQSVPSAPETAPLQRGQRRRTDDDQQPEQNQRDEHGWPDRCSTRGGDTSNRLPTASQVKAAAGRASSPSNTACCVVVVTQAVGQGGPAIELGR